MSAVLSFANVGVRFATRDAMPLPPAVDGVSLELTRGEILGIVGESGSGKSTLANTVMGLLPDNAAVTGSIRVNGREVIGLDGDELRSMRGNEVSMIFQDPSASLDPTWPVGDQIAETLRAHSAVSRRDAKARAIALMNEVGIADAASRYRDVPHRFSGGMRQRIVIAAALANNPQLLIADEPTTALDVTIQAQVLQLIDVLRREHGTTVLLITHDIGVVSQVCDRVGVMYGGRLLEVAATRELLASPTHPYTRALLAANPAGAPRAAAASPSYRQNGASTASGTQSCEPAGLLRRLPLGDLLRVDGLSKSFARAGGPPWRRRRMVAVDKVSLSVQRGRTLGLVGESGSGKSTLGRCILGLVKPDSGHISFDGVEVQALSGRALSEFRRRVQPVFQDPYGSLDPRWPVGRSVRESLDCFRIGTPADRDRRVLDLFARVGLNPALAGRLPTHLSGGQRQRVGIAAALASQPDLIIADEPVSSLDMSVQAQILNLFLDLRQDLGVASIFITHDLGVVEHVSDNVAVMLRGSIVETGDTEQVMQRPQHHYTRTLLAAVPRPR